MIRISHIAGTAALTLLTACSGPSSAEVEKYSEACADFYMEKRGRGVNHIEYGKHWMKEGKIVFSLKLKESKRDSSYTEGICVVDAEAGTISIPSVFDQARWAN